MNTLSRVVAVVLLAGSALGAQAQSGGSGPRATPPEPRPPGAAVPPPPAPPPAPSPADVDARLADAQRRLEQAAREIADLSLRGAARGVDRLFVPGEALRRAIIGVQIDPASGRDGARIAQVSPGGPAAAAGLRVGDVLQSLGGTDLRNHDDAARAVVERMADVEPEETLRARVLRDGKVSEVELVARRSPVAFAARALPLELPALPAEAMPRFEWLGEGPGVAGMELASITPGLGRYFGTDRGVLVVRAPRQAEWKLEDGDVILAIDGREPASGAHATRILRSYQRGETLKLRIMRQRKAVELAVAVPETEQVAGRRLRVVRLHGEGAGAGEGGALELPAGEANPVPGFGARPLPQQAGPGASAGRE